jgi:flagellum-specific peptidoglycan hydrolase FlgJ
MTPQAFFDKFVGPCQEAMRKNGGFASVRLAQVALESNWGESTPKDVTTGQESFNLTGVKGVGPAGSVKAWTNEEIDGRMVRVLADFRAYHDFDEHIVERDKIFAWSNYALYNAAKTPEEAIHGLVAAPMPYATDSSYERQLLALIEKYDLKRFDRLGPFVDVPADHPFASELADMKAKGYVKGGMDGKLSMSNESIRVLVICRRMIEGSK